MLDIKNIKFDVEFLNGDGKKWFTCKVKAEKLSFMDYIAAMQEGGTEVERNLATAKRANVAITNYPDIDGHKIKTPEDIFNLPADVVTKNPDHITAAMKLIRAIATKVTISEETEKN